MTTCAPDCVRHPYYELRLWTDEHPEVSTTAWGWGSWREAMTVATTYFLGRPLAIAGVLADLESIPFDVVGFSDDVGVITHGQVVRTLLCDHDDEVFTYAYNFRIGATP